MLSLLASCQLSILNGFLYYLYVLHVFKYYFIFIFRSLVDGANVKINQRWITRNYREDFDIITTKTSSQRRPENVMSIDSFATSKLCWVASLKSFLPSSELPPPGLLKMIKWCGHPLMTSKLIIIIFILVTSSSSKIEERFFRFVIVCRHRCYCFCLSWALFSTHK